jgi:hypothetical protein
MEQEIFKTILKLDYYFDNDTYYVCYDKESKKIRYLKYLIDNSINFKWCYREGSTIYSKKVICINKK